MLGRPRLSWLPRMLFRVTLLASVLLILLVLLAPLLDNGETASAGWRRAVALFAQDATLRRTAIASAVGLIVTACVFFRPIEAPPPPVARKRKQPGPTPPPAGAAGA